MNKTDLSKDLKKLFESLNVGSEEWIVDYDSNLHADKYSMAPKRQDSPVAKFSDDPLALSCASWRIFKNEPERRWTNLDTVKASSEDRDMAQNIRGYYNQRYTMQALKGRQLTEYQQKTAQFLSGLHHLTTDELGLLYKLPYFYTEDTALESVIEHTQTHESSPKREHTEYILTPVKEIFRTRKGGEIVQFWYRDQDNHAVLIDCHGTNPLLPMLRGLFKQSNLRVQSYAKLVEFDGLHGHRGLKLFMWELVL